MYIRFTYLPEAEKKYTPEKLKVDPTKGNSWELLTGFGFVHGGRKIQCHGVLFWRGCYPESEKV